MILIIIKIVKTVSCCSFNFFSLFNIYCNEMYNVIFLLNLSVYCKIIIIL